MEVKFRKLKANEIDVRVGKVIATENFEGVTLLLYKDARVDMQLLDETVGAMNWQRKHSRENANCAIGIYDNSKKEWVWKEDTGVESNSEAEKGLASDSFKRAGTNWGIGRELYSAPNILVECELNEKKKGPKSSISWYVSEITHDENGDIKTLVIVEKNRKAERVVYPLNYGSQKKDEGGKKDGSLTQKEMDQLPFDVPGQKHLTLEEALNVEVNMKDGFKKLKDLDDKTLELVIKHTVVPEWKEAATMILTYRGGQQK